MAWQEPPGVVRDPAMFRAILLRGWLRCSILATVYAAPFTSRVSGPRRIKRSTMKVAQPGKRMSIGLDTASDLFRKVERDRTALEREVTPDAVFNFVVTAHALCDWVQKDPTLSRTAKLGAVDLARTNEWLRACRDLANGSKHFTIDRYHPLVEHADAASGYGRGRYGVGAYGGGEWCITISWDGNTYKALDLVARVCEAWTAFFQDQAMKDDGAVAQLRSVPPSPNSYCQPPERSLPSELLHLGGLDDPRNPGSSASPPPAGGPGAPRPGSP